MISHSLKLTSALLYNQLKIKLLNIKVKLLYVSRLRNYLQKLSRDRNGEKSKLIMTAEVSSDSNIHAQRFCSLAM